MIKKISEKVRTLTDSKNKKQYLSYVFGRIKVELVRYTKALATKAFR